LLARRGAVGGGGPGREAERRGDKRERAAELEQQRRRAPFAWLARGVRWRRYRIHRHTASVTARPATELMKFSTSLFRIPGSSSVAPSQFATSAPAVAPMTIARSAAAGTSPSAAPIAASASAPRTPAAVPSSDIAPEVPGGTRENRVIDSVVRPYALP